MLERRSGLDTYFGQSAWRLLYGEAKWLQTMVSRLGPSGSVSGQGYLADVLSLVTIGLIGPESVPTCRYLFHPHFRFSLPRTRDVRFGKGL